MPADAHHPGPAPGAERRGCAGGGSGGGDAGLRGDVEPHHGTDGDGELQPPTNGSATAGSDYTHTTGTLTFAARTRLSKTISVPVLNDQHDEGEETLTLTLSDPHECPDRGRHGHGHH